jgi:hypothetical protein
MLSGLVSLVAALESGVPESLALGGVLRRADSGLLAADGVAVAADSVVVPLGGDEGPAFGFGSALAGRASIATKNGTASRVRE